MIRFPSSSLFPSSVSSSPSHLSGCSKIEPFEKGKGKGKELLQNIFLRLRRSEDVDGKKKPALHELREKVNPEFVLKLAFIIVSLQFSVTWRNSGLAAAASSLVNSRRTWSSQFPSAFTITARLPRGGANSASCGPMESSGNRG